MYMYPDGQRVNDAERLHRASVNDNIFDGKYPYFTSIYLAWQAGVGNSQEETCKHDFKVVMDIDISWTHRGICYLRNTYASLQKRAKVPENIMHIGH